MQQSNTVVVNKTRDDLSEVSDKINGKHTRFLVEFILKLNRSSSSYVYPETDTNYIDTKIHCIIF